MFNLLSICMMVKNEEKNLDRCLSSLENLRKNVNCELIIVDTGSDDKTVEIAKKYTNKIYFHEWNNNFSEMRNRTISYAKGDWILIIDADEELKEDLGIIQFFTNIEKFKEVNTLVIKSKDIIGFGCENNYNEYTSPRLFKNDGEFKYIGSVHNQPIYKEPILFLQSVTLIHYGYDSEDVKLMEYKFNRTAELLKKELAKDPQNIYYLYQLSSSYRMHKDYKESLDEIEKAYCLLKESSREIQKSHFYVYKHYIKCLLDFSLSKKAMIVCEEFLNLNSNDIDVNFFYADTLKFQKYLKQAKIYSIKYLDLVDKYENGENIEDTFSSYNFLDTIQYKEKVYSDLIEIHHELEEYEQILNFYKKIKDHKYIRNIIPCLINSLFKLNKLDEIIEYYYYIKNIDNDLENYFLYEIDKKIMNFKTDFNKTVISKLATLDTNYGYLNKIRLNYISNQSINFDLIDKMLESKFEAIDIYYADLIYFKLKHKKNIVQNLSEFEKTIIEDSVYYLNEKYDDFKDIIISNLVEYETDDIRELKVYIIINRFVIEKSNPYQYNYSNVFTEYTLKGIKYIYGLYSLELVQEFYNDIEDDEHKFFAYVNKSFLQDNKDDCINYLNKAKELIPGMERGIELLKEDILTR